MGNRRRELLEEIVEQIREALPKGINLGEWIDDAGRLQLDDMGRTIGDPSCIYALAYQWGRLLGCAEWDGEQPVLDLLASYGIGPVLCVRCCSPMRRVDDSGCLCSACGHVMKTRED